MTKSQTSLFEYYSQDSNRKRFARKSFGGQSTKGRRKLERPLSTQQWIHLVLKSDKAKGELSFLHARNRGVVKSIISAKAKKFGVHLAEAVNMGNHLHLRIRIQSRKGFQKFLKAITNLIARKVTGAKKGKPFGRFWQGLAFTRIINTRLELLRLKGYFESNRKERAAGPEARVEYLKSFNRWVAKLVSSKAINRSFG